MATRKEILENTVNRCRERDIIVPTIKEMMNPETVPEGIKEDLKNVGLWDLNSRNLFRITWKNEAKPKGGNYGGVNYIEIPSEITGVKARIIGLVGKWFPTGAHKVGAAFGCLAPRLVNGLFDPTTQKAVWPSTGNYCRGGAYVSNLLNCESIAILPEEMSKERFDWLKGVAGETIATPGCESNVKEIFDKCWELREKRGDDIMIFNQFEEFGNTVWHYHLTGRAIEEVANKEMKPGSKVAGVVLTTGSAGTIACGDYVKEVFPGAKLAAGEALQCPTLLRDGFGGHRIEGIGDKHVPWIHNVRNTDMIIAADDDDCMNVLRLFNEEAGHEYLKDNGVDQELIKQLHLLGISSIGNMICAIKFAKWYELTEDDIVFTVFTDSMELYGSRIKELEAIHGKYTKDDAIKDYHKHLLGIKTDNMLEPDYYEKLRIHNLKYYTWIEQQGRDMEELNRQWYDHEAYWKEIHQGIDELDEQIVAFNEMTGLLSKYK
ncbi:pyridoxal-phosphate dependent enzyme [bacterium]|nr:pyridoxal-phosphate dependent enzyme [bacterium]